ILYELIAGRHPFESERETPYTFERAICEREPPKLKAWAITDGGVHELERIVATAMRKNPTDRYTSVAELAAEIRSNIWADEASVHGKAFGPSLCRPRSTAIWVLSVATLSLAAAAWLVWKPFRNEPRGEAFKVEALTSLPGDEYRPS